MINYLKIGGSIYPKVNSIDTDDRFAPITDLVELKAAAIDTMNWLTTMRVQALSGGDAGKVAAAETKAIVLLAKVLAAQNPDVSSLTPLETSAWNKLLASADAAYCDSELLNTSLDALQATLTTFEDRSTRIAAAATIEDVVAIIEEV